MSSLVLQRIFDCPSRAVFLAGVMLFIHALSATAIDPVAAVSVSGSGDRIFAHSMDIASDGTIFVAAEVQDVVGHAIVVRKSEDGGLTWTDWSGLGLPGFHYRNPSIHIAEGNMNRVFLAYETADALSNPGAGSVKVAYSPLEAPIAEWIGHTVMATTIYPPSRPVVTSDAKLRSDYGVYVAFAWNVKFFNQVGMARSTDQGSSWDEAYNTYQGAFFIGTPDIVAGPDDYIQATWPTIQRAVIVGRAQNRAASWSDWTSSGPLTPSEVHGRNQRLATFANSNEIYAACTDVDEETMRVHRSSDAGATWSSIAEAPEIPIRDGDFAVGPLGYRLAGYDDPNSALIGEPTGADPLGSWELRPTGLGFTTSHAYPAEIDWDASRGNQWAILGHRESGSSEQLLFWGEWFQESAGVEQGPTALRLRLWPNPASDFTQLSLLGATPGSFTVRVYDPLGRLITRRDDAGGGGANGALAWDLRDATGRRVPNGSYYLKVDSGARSLAAARLIVR